MTPTLEKLAGITAQHNEIIKRVVRGSLDVDDVREALQMIIEKQYLIVARKPHEQWLPPTWYVSPERQLERVRQLNAERGWGFVDSDFPSVPAEFSPRTSTQVLLLAIYLPKKGRIGGVQRTFDEHTTVIQQQLKAGGLDYYRWEGLKSDPKHLRLANNIEHVPGIRWVAYDYAAHHDAQNGHRVVDLWNEGVGGLAASEVLSALMLFPEYGPSMDGDKVPFANMPGYQLFYDVAWSNCPYVLWWADYRQLELHARWAGSRPRVGFAWFRGVLSTWFLVDRRALDALSLVLRFAALFYLEKSKQGFFI